MLKDIYVPEGIARQIVDGVGASHQDAAAQRQKEFKELQQRLAALRTRMDRIYEDQLDGKIAQDLWMRKQEHYRGQELALETALSSLSMPISRDNVLTVQRIFELANKAYSLYLARNSAERGQLLKSVLLNCTTDGVTLSPAYRKPFDRIFQTAKKQEWSGRADLNCRPLAPQASALPG